MTAFRILQEALTNALRHGGEGCTRLELEYLPSTLRLYISNPTVGTTPAPELVQLIDGLPGSHGLIGIRERVALFGGSCRIAQAGRRFETEVMLPIGTHRMIRVLIADDQALVRRGLRSILEREEDIKVVDEVGNGLDAVHSASRLRPDVVLMDVRMPVMDGLTATEQILSGPGAAHRVIILTTFDVDEYIHAGLRAGACGFLLKDTEPDALVRAVRSAFDGDAMLSPSVRAA